MIIFILGIVLIAFDIRKIFYNRALIYLNLKRYDKAQSDLEKYVKINLEHPKMFVNLGIASRHNHQYQKSLNAINKAIQMEPGNMNFYFERMLTFFEMGEVQRARAELSFLKSKGLKNIPPKYEKLMSREN